MNKKILTVLAATALFGIGCSSMLPVSTQAPVDNIQATTGSLQFNLSDGDTPVALAKKIIGRETQADVVEHIWITIREVQLHIADDTSEKGWKTVATPNKKFDFLDLVNGLTAPLDLYALQPGHYTQFRLILATDTTDANGKLLPANTIVLNGETFPLTIPSAYRTGIKCVRSFFIEENEVTEICLKFDTFKAIHYAPGKGYMMKPAYRTYKCEGADLTDTKVPPLDPADTEIPSEPPSGDADPDW